MLPLVLDKNAYTYEDDHLVDVLVFKTQIEPHNFEMTLTRNSTTPGKIRVAVFGRFGRRWVNVHVKVWSSGMHRSCSLQLFRDDVFGTGGSSIFLSRRRKLSPLKSARVMYEMCERKYNARSNKSGTLGVVRLGPTPLQRGAEIVFPA